MATRIRNRNRTSAAAPNLVGDRVFDLNGGGTITAPPPKRGRPVGSTNTGGSQQRTQTTSTVTSQPHPLLEQLREMIQEEYGNCAEAASQCADLNGQLMKLPAIVAIGNFAEGFAELRTWQGLLKTILATKRTLMGRKGTTTVRKQPAKKAA